MQWTQPLTLTTKSLGEGLGRISRRFASDPEQRRQAYFNLLSRDRPLAYFSNIGGMYPTIPSKWPPALIYAIMDGFLEKLGEIVSLDDPQYNFSATRLRGQMREETGTMLYVPNPFKQAQVSPGQPVQDWTEQNAPDPVEIAYPSDYRDWSTVTSGGTKSVKCLVSEQRTHSMLRVLTSQARLETI